MNMSLQTCMHAHVHACKNNLTHTCVTIATMLHTSTATTGYLSFGPMAKCAVHALKGLACRASPSRVR